MDSVTCKLCKGTGKQHGFRSELCTMCKGDKVRPWDAERTNECPLCMTTGLERGYGPEACHQCDGYGFVYPPAWQQEGEAGPLAWFLEAGKPRTAHLTLRRLFASLSGHVRICDPYYGHGSLLRLDLLKDCKPIWFLTKRADEKERLTLPRAIREYRKEYAAVEFREHSGTDLHDRFILAENELVLLGGGLKDVGNKDSFVVKLDRSLVGETIDLVLASFDQRWHAASARVIG